VISKPLNILFRRKIKSMDYLKSNPWIFIIFCFTNTTGYARGSKKLLALSRKRVTSFVRINTGPPTALTTKEVTQWIVKV
jgi:hypothetical protein